VIRIIPFVLGALVGGIAVALLSSPPAPRPSPEPDRAPIAQAQAQAQARAAAEERVRGTRGGSETRFRGVQTYQQAMPAAVAVCGQTNLAEGQNFVPFVAVVTSSGEGRPEVELYLARTGAEATRVYVEGVARCFEGGGPVPRQGGGVLMPPNVPPLPTGLGDVAVTRAASPPTISSPVPPQDQGAPAPAQLQPAPQALATREARPGMAFVVGSNANVRAEPSGSGPVLRVARPGTSFRIFGEAPGGWYQVGTVAPEGWVHGSLGAVQ
jgi:hypothetical protein